MLLAAFLLCIAVAPSIVTAEDENVSAAEIETESEQHYAILYPWVVEAFGIIIFLLLTRSKWLGALPYTAMLFLLGTVMGIGSSYSNVTDQLTQSILQWDSINSEVLLLVFLPGLIFRDAFGLNVHLFELSFGQCLIFAFPMVLAGTVLVALVAYYIFPYNWTFNMAMTLGAILSATDPVAVSSLLNEVGAPPRLKMHIGGESLLNDGSAIVFFTIFSSRFLNELDIGLGEDVDLRKGIALFCRMAFGGTAVGLAFGLALIYILHITNRRLNMEENVLQVTATVTTAYLCYYVADAVCSTSGVIAVVFCGVTTKAFATPLINDPQLMESFWVMVEHLLNTLLFALGGVVWGGIIANNEEKDGIKFDGVDWGYLILLYVFLTVIRYFLVFAFYPLTSRMGLGQSWQEAFFMSFGGLRGAVGISLAISLDKEVSEALSEDDTFDQEKRDLTQTLFGLVGGVAFISLIINGTFAGPILRKLKLADPTETRARIVKGYTKRFNEQILAEFIRLLADPRFRKVDFALVRHHVPYLNGVTAEDFIKAVQRDKGQVGPDNYEEPHTDNVLSYLTKGDTEKQLEETTKEPVLEGNSWLDLIAQEMQSTSIEMSGETKKTVSDSVPDQNTMLELRKIFLEFLRSSYDQQIENGELEARGGIADLILLDSLEFAGDAVNKGEALSDWEKSSIIARPLTDLGERVLLTKVELVHLPFFKKQRNDLKHLLIKFQKMRLDVIRAMSFIHAHHRAQSRFRQEFVVRPEFSAEEKQVIEESKGEVLLAIECLRGYDPKAVRTVVSHAMCAILLNKAAKLSEHWSSVGLLKEKEASALIEEVEEHLLDLHTCAVESHPGEHTTFDN